MVAKDERPWHKGIGWELKWEVNARLASSGGQRDGGDEDVDDGGLGPFNFDFVARGRGEDTATMNEAVREDLDIIRNGMAKGKEKAVS